MIERNLHAQREPHVRLQTQRANDRSAHLDIDERTKGDEAGRGESVVFSQMGRIISP